MLRGVMRGTIVALLLTACTTAMHFRVIDKGAYGAEASKPSVTVTKGRNESVIRLELGSRPTGGWAIEPLEVSGDPSLATVKTKIVAPPAGGIVTMALTAPYAVIAIDADVKAVRWVDENGNLIAESK
jgi:hypothetical protein